jgi:DNA/RNA endonuclease YhcR with UshA esterase domain
MAKYTQQDHKTNEDILSELKINPVVKKIQNYRNKCIKRLLTVNGTGTGHREKVPAIYMMMLMTMMMMLTQCSEALNLKVSFQKYSPLFKEAQV